jgi:chemotaxis protein MotB
MAGKKDKEAKKEVAPPNSLQELSLLNSASGPQKAEEEEEYMPLWLITFTDIMALMLTFFVLLYSMSVPEVESWEDLTTSINKGFSKFYSPRKFSGPQDTIEINKLDLSQALNLDYLRGLIETKIGENDILYDVVLISADDRLIISMPEDLLFDAGNDEVGVQGKRALFALGGILSNIKNRIEVVGHTDPRPISDRNQKFESNWELSLSRATQVSNILMQVGYRRPVIVRGMSSARYDELPESLPDQQRLDLSRRVDIVVMTDDGRTRKGLMFGSF